MKISVEHIGLPARNPTALKEWYLHTLNGEIVFESGTTPPAYFVRLGGAMLEIYEGDFSARETGDNKCNGFRHLALRVDSIESAKKELEQRGVRFGEDVKPAGGGGRVLFFQDCEGNLLHLVERPVGSIFDV
ncbi:MAG: VOC family protein [Verrucomicrobia bacterium]|nr:VOC family protein [Verrucomicrobiota bacterium]